MSSPIGGSFGDSAETRASEFGAELGSELESASRQVRRGFERAGAKLDDGADKLKDGLRHTSDGVRSAGKRVSNVVGNSSEYLRANGLNDMIEDVEGVVRQHPGKALLAVAAIGFLLGRSLTSRE